jgi:hypothetical protein
MSIRDQYAEIDEDFVFFDDLDDAVIGYVSAVVGENVILYDRGKVIEILMRDNGWTDDEAEEYFSFNIIGAYVGDRTPMFATLLPIPKERVWASISGLSTPYYCKSCGALTPAHLYIKHIKKDGTAVFNSWHFCDDTCIENYKETVKDL